MAGIFWDQIKDILTPGRACMSNVPVSTNEGVFLVDLTDYKTVKKLGPVIAGALNGWQRDNTGQWVDPPKPTKRNAMPPNGPLAVEDVDMFLAWVADGMPEAPLVA